MALRGVNLQFLTSGQQFMPSPPGGLVQRADDDYVTTSQKLSQYHAMTSEAMVVAAKEGTLPASPPKHMQ